MNIYEHFELHYPRRLKRYYKDMETPTNEWDVTANSIIDLCLELRASTNGHSDPWPKSEIKKAMDVINFRLNNWNKSNDEIDECVRKILINAVGIAERELKRDWDFNNN